MKVQLHESLLGRKQEDFKEDVEYTELRPRIASVLESEIGTWRLRASKAVEKEEGASLDPMKIQETEHPPDLKSAYTVLFVLLFTFVSNQWTRQSINYLCNFSDSTDDGDKDQYMNLDLNFDQEQYATLSSIIFSVFFASFSLFAGSASDKYRRDWMALIGCGVWSVATAAQAFIDDYGLLCIARVIIAVSQAYFNPVAYTLLADLFPTQKLAEANGIFTSGIYLGGGLASISIVMDQSIGWRMTMLVIGAIGGLATMLVFFFVKDPRGDGVGTTISTSKHSMAGEDDDGVHRNSRIVQLKMLIRDIGIVFETSQSRYIYMGSTIRFMAGFSILTWKAPFIFDKFEGEEEFFSLTNAIVVGVVGLLSTVLGGYLADLIANPPANSRRKPRARAWVPAIGSLLAVPCWIFFIMAPTLELTMVALTFEYICAECWFGPVLATLFTTVDPSVRGTAQGIFSVLTAVGNVAPLLIGSMAGGSMGDYYLGDVLLFAVGGFYAISGVIFVKVAMNEDENLKVEREKLQNDALAVVGIDEGVTEI